MMDIDFKAGMAGIARADLVNSGGCANSIICAALEAAGEAILALEAVRLDNLVHFCNTGRFLVADD